MGNRWIVSPHKFHEHYTLDAAKAERERLSKSKGKSFVIYRVKNRIEPDEGELLHGEEG